MEMKVYNQAGKETGTVKLPDDVFAVPWNADLVHQVVVSMTSNARTPVAHTKDRSEVRGGGRKPWQQKGTGQARHGSRRSPIWVGGGAHGPRNDKNYEKKINRKMKAKALSVILSRKLKDNEIIFVDSINFAEPKTSQALGVVKSLGGIKGYERLANKRVNAAFIALSKKDRTVEKSFDNFGNIEVGEMRNLNPLQILNYKYLVIAEPAESLKTFIKAS
jgi:large subunit ribosomal protein L4